MLLFSMCFACGRGHKRDPEEDVLPLLAGKEIIDEALRGHGYHKSPEQTARLKARTDAWVSLGFAAAYASWLGRWTWTPISMAQFPDDILDKINCIGKTTIKRLRELSPDAEEQWQATFQKIYPWHLQHATDHINRYRG